MEFPIYGNPHVTTEVTYYHIHFESWDVYPLDYEYIQKTYTSMAPRNLGSLGYDGLSTMYIPKPVQQQAYSTTGNLD